MIETSVVRNGGVLKYLKEMYGNQKVKKKKNCRYNRVLKILLKDIVLQNIVHEARNRLDGPKGSQEDALEKPYKYFSLSNSLTENEGETANFYVFQKIFQGDFQFDVLFRSKSNPEPLTSKY